MTFKTRAGMLAAALGLAIAFPAASYASDGTINFTGSLTDNTCTVTAGASNSQTVTMPPVSTGTLTATAKVAGYTQFNIALSACSEATKSAHAYFEAGPSIDFTSGNLLNTEPTATAAKDVQIGLFNADRTQLVLNKEDAGQLAKEVPLVKGADNKTSSGTLTYYAAYVLTGAKAAAGKVASTVTYTISYK